MRLRRILTCAAAGALIVGTAFVAAPSASAGAPIIWHQAVAVPTAASPCPVTTDAEKAKGWTDWTGSWAQWPNDGKGGNVCTRSITWAHEADAAGPSGPGCVDIIGWWLDFGNATVLPPNAPAYLSADCTGSAVPSGSGYSVYASSIEAAQDVCDVLQPGRFAMAYGAGTNAFFCAG